MAAEKNGKENERKWKKGGSSGETAAPVSLLPKEVIHPKFVQTEAYIGAQCMGNYKKKTETKSYYKDKMGKKPKTNANRAKCKKQERAAG